MAARLIFRAISLALLLPPRLPAQGVSHGRPMLPVDLLSIRSYETTEVSPDGQLIAVVIKRSRLGPDIKGAARNNRPIGFHGSSDLWIVQRSGARHRLTPEDARLSDGTPVWSPAGTHLAFLSADQSGNVFLRIWDRQTAKVWRAVSESVDLDGGISKVSQHSYDPPMSWIDENHIAVLVMEKGVKPLSTHIATQSLTSQYRGLQRALAGRVATAVVASNPPDSASLSKEPRAQLLVVDATTAHVRRVAEMPAIQMNGACRFVVLSPNGRLAAIVATQRPGVSDSIAGWLVYNMWPTSVGLVSLAGGSSPIHWLSDLTVFRSMGSLGRLPLAWNAEASAFALVTLPHDALTTSKPDSAASLLLNITTVNAQTAAARSIATMTLTDLSSDEHVSPRALAWTGDGHVLVRRRLSDASPLLWFVVDTNGLRDSTAPDTSRTSDPTTVSQLSTSHPDDRLYETDSSGHGRTLFPALNPQLVGIAQPKFVRFRYTGRNGETLNASALLPYGYVAGHRYPTIVRVYGGERAPADDNFATVDDDDFMNWLVLSGHGYVVLKPSVPLLSLDHPDDAMLHLNDGVDPAVDSLIRLGIADSTRLGLIGHSYGGYTVNGLLPQTTRYKAAVSLAGLSDLVSTYGTFGISVAYTEPNEAAFASAFYLERSEGRVGEPWINPERYVRNSPIFFADKIATPLLLITGDLDEASQSEELFSAMYRLNRRVELVRYLGEGHYIDSPPNVLDLWNRIFGWFDAYLGPSAPTGRASFPRSSRE